MPAGERAFAASAGVVFDESSTARTKIYIVFFEKYQDANLVFGDAAFTQLGKN